ncbi:winged helix-turn-helix transcriptional regulator [Candidatus Bathyarchaeota archaeon]|nr:winged helix-turn-helix transcriptional regulator [Candidatus Bathyarchaeota archaeon]
MTKQAYHPNAYLSSIRNIKRGLDTRTKILNILDKHPMDVKSLAKEASAHYNVVMHHLRLLGAEGIVERRGIKPFTWKTTGIGQKRLVASN